MASTIRDDERPSRAPTARRRLWLWLGAVLLLAGLALAGFWWYGAGRFGAAVDDWLAARRAEGFRIDAPAPRIDGFPLRWAARFPTLAIAAPADDGGPPRWQWQGHAVTVAWSLLDRESVHVGSSGTSSLDLRVDGRVVPILIDSDGIALRLDAIPGAMARVAGKAERLSVSMAGLDATAQSLGFELAVDPAAPIDHTALAATLAVDAKQFSVPSPGQAQPALILSGSVALSLMGRPPPGPPAQAVAAWRDAGGTIELTNVDVSAGGVAMKGSGTVALDAEMRPIGAGTAAFRGIDQALDRLVAAGQMSARDLPLAKLAFTALARPDPATGVSTLTLPVTAENGFLFLGPIKIAPLHPLKLE